MIDSGREGKERRRATAFKRIRRYGAALPFSLPRVYPGRRLTIPMGCAGDTGGKRRIGSIYIREPGLPGVERRGTGYTSL